MLAIRRCLVLPVVLVCVAPVWTAQPEPTISLDWRFAGSFLQNLARTAAPPAPPSTIAGRTVLILLSAKGSPGPATLRVSNGGGAAVQPPDGFPVPPAAEVCEGLPVAVIGGENGLIATLEGDLSLLYGVRDASMESHSCTDAAGVNHGVIYLVFVGGTGRFAEATGRGVITFHAKPIVSGSAFLAETGDLRGTVSVAR